MKMRKKQSVIVFSVIILIFVSSQQPILPYAQKVDSYNWFPFTIPWDDTEDNIINVGKLVLDAPAGKHGFLKVKDGHFYFEDNTRIRFWGANLVQAANFPSHKTAEKTASHMAKYGFNIVRLHLLDYDYAPNGIFAKTNNNTLTLDSSQMDKLDYLIYQLKRNGIYVDLNLHAGRKFTENDGIAEVKGIPPYSKYVTIFDQKLIELQKKYAFELLTHYNPYTKSTYNKEPCIALIETTNENSLFSAFVNGEMHKDSASNILSDYYLNELDQKWNEWLNKRYGNTANLKKAWEGQISSNVNLINKIEFKQEIHEEGGAAAYISIDRNKKYNNSDSIRIDVKKTGSYPYYVQIKYIGVKLEKGKTYTLGFNSASSAKTEIHAGFGMDHSPWKNYGLSKNVSLNTSWKEYKINFTSNESTGNDTRLSLELGKNPCTIWLNNIKLTEANVMGSESDESLENGNIKRISWSNLSDYSSKRASDETEFYYSLEKEYFKEMLSYIKNSLSVKVPVSTTNSYYGQPDLLAQTEGDYTDSHNYWDFMSFPNKFWDPYDFNQKNISLISDNSNNASFFNRLSLSAIDSKPFVVSEWNVCFPNDYAYEAVNLLASYALLQDWDGLFIFAYFHETDENYNTNYIKPYHWFNVVQNPGKMAQMPTCALSFIRGDIKPANRQISLNYSRSDIFSRFKDDSMNTNFNIEGSIPYSTIFKYRLRKSNFNAAQTSSIKNIFSEKELSDPQNSRIFKSDTGELTWNARETSGEYIICNTPRLQGANGFISGKEINLNNLNLKLNTDCSVTLVSTDNKNIGDSRQMLFTAVSSQKNTNQQKDNKTNGLTNWGNGPVIMEPVTGIVELKVDNPGSKYSIYALDPYGNRMAAVPYKIKNRSIIFNIGNDHTPWYEIIQKS